MIAVLRNWSSSARAFAQDAAARPVRLRPFVEGLLVAVLLVQGGRLVWLFVEPSPVAAVSDASAATRPIDMSIFQRFDAFFRTGGQSSMAEDTATGSSQMRLFGVRADGAGGGSAIIGLADGRQLSVGVGEEVEPGLVLRSVGDDHVVLSRNGALSRLIFAETPVGAAPPPPPPATPQVVAPPSPSVAPAAADVAVVNPAQLMAQASLRPRMRGLAVNGFTVSATGDGSALRAAGLESGDVILAVNGTELNSPARIADLRRDLANSPSAEIRYERGGQVRTTTIRTAR